MGRKTAGIVPCTKCRFPTRPERWSIEDHPNTRLRRRGLCWKCYETEHPRLPKKNTGDGPPRPETIAGLEWFMAGRARREAAAARRQYPHLYRRETV